MKSNCVTSFSYSILWLQLQHTGNEQLSTLRHVFEKDVD